MLKTLPKILPTRKESSQPVLGPDWCFPLLTATWEPHGVSGRLLCLHTCPTTLGRPSHLFLQARSPQERSNPTCTQGQSHLQHTTSLTALLHLQVNQLLKCVSTLFSTLASTIHSTGIGFHWENREHSISFSIFLFPFFSELSSSSHYNGKGSSADL